MNFTWHKEWLARLPTRWRLTLVTLGCLSMQAAMLGAALALIPEATPRVTASLEEGARTMQRLLLLIVPSTAGMGALSAFWLLAPVGAAGRALPATLLTGLASLVTFPLALLLLYVYDAHWLVLLHCFVLPPALGSWLLWRGRG